MIIHVFYACSGEIMLNGKETNYKNIILPLIIFILIGLLLFPSTGRDDSHITYWASYSLKEFGHLYNYNGQRVEQSSSLLQSVLLALLGRITGIQINWLGSIFSILFGLFSIITLYALTVKVEPQAALPSAYLFASYAYFIYWSFSGMETSLTVFVILNLFLSFGHYIHENKRSRRNFIWLGISIFCFVSVRPEMPLVLVSVLFPGIMLVILCFDSSKGIQRRIRNRVIEIFCISMAITIALFVFRLIYFNKLFPQSVYAKSNGLKLGSIYQGVEYYLLNILQNLNIVLLFPYSLGLIYVGVLIIKNFFRSNDNLNFYILFPYVFVFVFSAFAILTGGDWMEGGRFLVPIIPFLIMFVSISFLKICRRSLFPLLILLVIQAMVTISFASRESTGMPIWKATHFYKNFGKNFDSSRYSWFERTNRVHLRDIPTIYYLDHVIDDVSLEKGDTLNIMSHQMGMVSYYISKEHFHEVYMLDMRGLIEDSFVECPVTARLERRNTGLPIDLEIYFKNQRELSSVCRIPEPDIIFGLDGKEEVLKKNGYIIVYEQKGTIDSGSWIFPGRERKADQYIAINEKLTVNESRQEKVIINFSEIKPLDD